MSIFRSIFGEGLGPGAGRVDIDPAEYVRTAAPDAPVVDVRTALEFAQLHLAGAHHVDIMDDQFVEKLEQLGVGPDQPVYLYCRSGSRSGHAARLLRRHGYTQAYNIGGVEELIQEGAPPARS
jgi:phage shock protein E